MMKFHKNWQILRFAVVLVLLPFYANAQSYNGVFGSNYNNNYNVRINPTAIGNSKNFLEISIFDINGYFNSNYLYFKDVSSPFLVLAGKEKLKFPSMGNAGDFVIKPDLRIDIYGSVEVHGPSFTLTYGRHSFAFSNSFKTILDGRFVNKLYGYFVSDLAEMQELAQDYNNGIATGATVVDQNAYPLAYEFLASRIGKQKGGMMMYGEVSLTYNYSFSNKFDFFTVGGSLKPNIGLHYYGISATAKENFKPYPDEITWASSTPILGGKYSKFSQSGLGLGLDFGFTWYRMEDDAFHYNPHYSKDEITDSRRYRCQIMDYKYKIGVSLLDVGFTSFKGTYAVIKSPMLLQGLAGGGDISSVLNQDVRLAKITAMLATAFSVQFDYKFFDHFYLNTTLIQSFPQAHPGISRPSLLAVSPRYETKWFEASLPVTLLDWRAPQVGLFLRFYNVSFGFDNLFQWYNPVNGISGISAYMQITAALSNHPACKPYLSKKGWRKGFKYNSYAS